MLRFGDIDTEQHSRRTARTAVKTAACIEDAALDGRLDVPETSVPLLTATVSDDAAARNSADAALSARLDVLESDPTTSAALAMPLPR